MLSVPPHLSADQRLWLSVRIEHFASRHVIWEDKKKKDSRTWQK